MANVLLTTLGAGGDINPFLTIGRALKARGHAVTLLTHCDYEETARQAAFEFVALDTPRESKSFVEDGPLLNSLPGVSLFFQKHILPKVLLEYDRLKERHRPGETVLVAHHLTGIAARLAAETLRLPFLPLFTVPSQITTLPVLEKLCSNTLAADINRLRGAVGLPDVSDWRAWLSRPRRSIAAWPDWFAAPAPHWPPGVATVGFLALDSSTATDVPPEAQEMLDGDAPPILITGGLGTFMGLEFYTIGAEACHLLGKRGLLVTRHRQQVPGQLPAGICWFPYLPFAQVMPRIGAVIHHGGIGTLAHALAAGIPQLALAIGTDRLDSSAHLQRLGVAEYLVPSRWQPELVAQKLRQLVNSSHVAARCQELAQQTRRTEPAIAACQVIEQVIASADAGEQDLGLPAAADASTSGQAPAPEPQARDLLAQVDRLSPEKRALLALQFSRKTDSNA